MLLGLTIPWPSAAKAVEIGDAAAGRYLAETWCSGCHRIGAVPDRGPVRDAVPDFVAVARLPSTTASSLNAWLSTQHQAMPDFHLTRDQIQDVSAYILSLRPTSSPTPQRP